MVAYAIVRDTAVNWEDFHRVAAAPRGLLLHMAGRTPEGVREIEVWRSRRDLERYQRASVRRPDGDASLPLRSPSVREFVVEHVLQQWTENE